MNSTFSLLSGALTVDELNEKLINVPKVSSCTEPQHQYIRQGEKAKLESILINEKCAWLIYDWGLGKESFVSCVVDRLNANKKTDVFRFLCDDIDDSAELETHFKKQFDLSLQEFIFYSSKLNSPVLFIDEISPHLLNSGSESRKVFDRIISTILDFSPNLSLLLASRQRQNESKYKSVQLKPLDLPDVANYINKHQKSRTHQKDISIVEELYRHSEGLPMHLDRLIETLQVASVRDLTDLEYDLPLDSMKSSEPVPKALEQAVATISRSDNKFTRRGFTMLKALSVLPEGETLHTIKRLNDKKPFYPETALKLIGLTLLTVDVTDRSGLRFTDEQPGGNLTHEPDNRVLCVPRQVRDYINAIISDKERIDIVNRAADLLFGEKWRSGEIKLTRAKTLGLRGTISTGTGNEHSVIRHLLRNAIQIKSNHDIKRALKLASSYCQQLKNNDRYNDNCIATEEFLTLIEDLSFHEEYAELTILRAKSLRMMGKRDLSLKLFNRILENHASHTRKSALASIYLNIALIHEHDNRCDAAVKAAKKVQELKESDSSTYMHAESIILSFEDEPKRTKSLVGLMTKARLKEHFLVANNIALDLVAKSKNTTDQLDKLNYILSSKGDDPYTRIRAVIKKVNTLSSVGRLNELDQKEKMLLNFSYSYLYAQRFTSLFAQCHDAVWQILKSDSNFRTLLTAFRLSSFLWRIRGEEHLEEKYLTELQTLALETIREIKDEHVETDIIYFQRRIDQKLLSN